MKAPHRFVPAPCPETCRVSGRHSHGNEWREKYWLLLTEDEREYLRDMSTRYQQSLMASSMSERLEEAGGA